MNRKRGGAWSEGTVSIGIPVGFADRYRKALAAAQEKTAGEWGALPAYAVVITALELMAGREDACAK